MKKVCRQTESTQPPPPPPPQEGLSIITWPTEGLVLSGDVNTFYFTPGVAAMNEWRIAIGSNSDATGLFDSGVKSLAADPWFHTFNGAMPATGSLTMRFWQRTGGGSWSTFDQTTGSAQ